MTSPETIPLSVEQTPLTRPELAKAEQFIGLACLSLGVEINQERTEIVDTVPPAFTDQAWPTYFLEGLYKAVRYNQGLQDWLSGYLDDVNEQSPNYQLIRAHGLYMKLADELGSTAAELRSAEFMVSRHQNPRAAA